MLSPSPPLSLRGMRSRVSLISRLGILLADHGAEKTVIEVDRFFNEKGALIKIKAIALLG